METTINGIRIYYEDQGQGAPLVLIHGFPLERVIWEPMIPLIRKDVRVISPDLRGFGRSEATRGVSGMRLLADDIAGLLDHLKIDRAVIAGHSMGGYVALAFAQAYPGRISALGMIASQSIADTPEKRAGRYAQAEAVTRSGAQSVADSMASKLTGDPNLQAKLYDLILHTNPDGIVAALKGMGERGDSVGFLSDITVPAAVIHGCHDVLIPIERARETAAGIPRAILTEIPQAGHMPMMETPEETAGALNALMDETLASQL
ncbi:MAG: alpha/beta fold hydrolase [Anaerolineaceae bacterium]|nr:alpha/beta fold hydrolase [Anaerolineaceae bacterium]